MYRPAQDPHLRSYYARHATVARNVVDTDSDVRKEQIQRVTRLPVRQVNYDCNAVVVSSLFCFCIC